MWISCFKVLYIIKLCAQAWFPFPELAIHCLDTSLNENKERNTITLHIKKLKEIPESNQGKITNDASIYWRGQRWVWKSQRYCLHTSRSQLILLPMGFFWVFNVFNSTLHHHHRCQDTEEENKDIFWENDVYRSSFISWGCSGGSLWPNTFPRHFVGVPSPFSHIVCLLGQSFHTMLQLPFVFTTVTQHSHFV